jgi:hypothetical protein
MATRRLARAKASTRARPSTGLHDSEHDTPLNRQVRAELEQEGWLPNTPGSVDSLNEAMHTRDEAWSEESSSPPSTPLTVRVVARPRRIARGGAFLVAVTI